MNRTAHSLLVGALACGSPTAPTTPADPPAAGETRRKQARPPAPAPQARHHDGPAHTLVLIVLDTVRADHTSLCGYGRPTTPFLASLPGAHACSVVTPAPWTLPSHATYFTGLTPPEHGVQFVTGGVDVAGAVTVRPLDAAYTTLAERLSSEGWMTALVTGNAVLNPSSGLTQGFSTILGPAIGDGNPALRGDKLVDSVRQALDGAPADKPLLLVVNIYDAHDPYPAIGPRHAWLPPHPRLALKFNDLASPYVAFHRGDLPAAERSALLTQATDTYDHGVQEADQTLRGVWGALDHSGRLDRRHRVVITSDHGELLGEHDRMRHGGHLWEPLLRAPLVFLDSGAEPPDLSGDIAGVEIYHLLALGRRPDPRPAVIAWSEQIDAHPDRGVDGAVLYAGGEKFWKVDGQFPVRYAIGADPGEQTPTPVTAPVALQSAFDAGQQTRRRPVSRPVDPSALRALGYAE
jgi:hypothetical protein